MFRLRAKVKIVDESHVHAGATGTIELIGTQDGLTVYVVMLPSGEVMVVPGGSLEPSVE